MAAELNHPDIRRFERLNVEIAATAAPQYAGASRQVPISVKDMSVSGLYFVSARRFVVGMSVQVEMRCLGKRVVVDAIVRHCRHQGDNYALYGIGVQFLNTLPVRGALPTIAGFIAREREFRTSFGVAQDPPQRLLTADRMADLLREKDQRIAELTQALDSLTAPLLRAM